MKRYPDHDVLVIADPKAKHDWHRFLRPAQKVAWDTTRDRVVNEMAVGLEWPNDLGSCAAFYWSEGGDTKHAFPWTCGYVGYARWSAPDGNDHVRIVAGREEVLPEVAARDGVPMLRQQAGLWAMTDTVALVYPALQVPAVEGMRAGKLRELLAALWLHPLDVVTWSMLADLANDSGVPAIVKMAEAGIDQIHQLYQLGVPIDMGGAITPVRQGFHRKRRKA